MNWARTLAFVTGQVDQELLARNEYLAAENRIGRLIVTDDITVTRRVGRDAIAAINFTAPAAACPKEFSGWSELGNEIIQCPVAHQCRVAELGRAGEFAGDEYISVTVGA